MPAFRALPLLRAIAIPMLAATAVSACGLKAPLTLPERASDVVLRGPSPAVPTTVPATELPPAETTP